MADKLHIGEDTNEVYRYRVTGKDPACGWTIVWEGQAVDAYDAERQAKRAWAQFDRELEVESVRWLP